MLLIAAGKTDSRLSALNLGCLHFGGLYVSHRSADTDVWPPYTHRFPCSQPRHGVRQLQKSQVNGRRAERWRCTCTTFTWATGKFSELSGSKYLPCSPFLLNSQLWGQMKQSWNSLITCLLFAPRSPPKPTCCAVQPERPVESEKPETQKTPTTSSPSVLLLYMLHFLILISN